MLKKRIPTIVGLLLLLFGVMGGVIFINQGTNFLPRAAPEYVPQKVKITNITDSGFVISWITTEPSVGFIKYAASPLNLSETASDDRDQLSGSRGEYRTHYVTLQNLNPATTYYFKIGSQQDQLYDNNGQPFAISLPAVIDKRPAADTVFGTVLTSVDTPAEGSILYLSIAGGTPLSALVKQNGNWAVNLSLVRSTDLATYASYDPQTTQIDLLIQSDEVEPTVATTTTGNDQPVPTIILGRSNNFISQLAAAPTPTPVSTPAPAAAASKFNLDPLSVTETKTVTITSIPASGVINSAQPEFSGNAPPNTSLVITVHSAPAYTGNVVSDKSGKWQWLAPTRLESGEHTVAVSYTDAAGKVHSVQKTFSIGGISLQQVDLVYAATPSATPKPTPTPTPTPKPTATPKASLAPTPTAVPSPTPRATVASGSADIVAGTTSMSIITIIVGVIMIGLGLGSKKLFPGR